MPIGHLSASNIVASAKLGSIKDIDCFSGDTLKGRDVVLLNPYHEGRGDHALGNKIANIAVGVGCRVTVIPLCTIEYEKNYHPPRNISLQGTFQGIGALHEPVFVIAPVGILPVHELETALVALCEKHQFPKQEVVLIEEMDILVGPGEELERRVEMLGQIGFKTVVANRLGFGDGAIGYLPTDQAGESIVRSRFEAELEKLFDGYNVAIDKGGVYHLAYISSDVGVTATQVFVANTLSEDIKDYRNAHFVIVLRQLDERIRSMLPKVLEEMLLTQDEFFDLPALYSKFQIFFADSVTGDLTLEKEVNGEGGRLVNIVVVNTLPSAIFEDFMCLTHAGMGSGMSSGDQSFSEFLSRCGKVPFYDMQPWKEPLVDSLKKIAENVGGEELVKELEKRFVGRKPFSGELMYSFSENRKQSERSTALGKSISEFEKRIRSRTADRHIAAVFEGFKGNN